MVFVSKSALLLILLAHSSAGFDAWTTRRALNAGRNWVPPAYEKNSEYRWASRSPALYLVMQDKAAVATVLLLKTKPGTKKRTLAIAAAVAVTVIHTKAGIGNLRKVARNGAP